MRDRRPADELSIEELEHLLAIRRREARQRQMAKMERSGRTVNAPPVPVPAAPVSAVQVPPVTVSAVQAQHAQPVQAQHAQPRASLEAQTGDAPAFVFDDEPAAQHPAPKPKPPRYTLMARREPKSRAFHALLTVVEVAAVFAIAVIGLNLFGALRGLERETAVAQQLADEQRRAVIPTLAPTPTLRLENVVLPGGHTIQNGAPVFNYAEVPEHLLPLVESQWVQPVISRPQPTSETALALTIPSLNISQTIVQGVDWEALKQGIGQLPNEYNPGDDGGNVVFAAHNDIYGQIFRYLDQLEPGDQFQVQTQTHSYTYTVTETRIVAPNDVSVLQPRGTATATLISCYPFGVNDRRIVVFADRIG
jgi:sortase A